MTEYWGAFAPQFERFPINSGDYLDSHQRIAKQRRYEEPIGQVPSLTTKRSGEQSAIGVGFGDGDSDPIPWRHDHHVVGAVHRYKWRHVEFLVEAVTLQAAVAVNRYHVGMGLAEGIVDFVQDCAKIAGGRVTEINAEWIEHIAEHAR